MARPFGTYKLTPEELYDAFIEYKAKCEEYVKYESSSGKIVAIPTPLIYTVEDFCDYADIDDDTFNEYGKLPDYSATVKKIRKSIFARKQRALVNAEGSTTGLIFDMKANYGINDKNFIDLSGEVSNKIIIIDAAGCEPIATNANERDTSL